MIIRKLQRLPDAAQRWVSDVGGLTQAVWGYLRDLDGYVRSLSTLPTYTVATVPDAVQNVRVMIYVSNEAGGAVPAFSDGTNWRRVTDRAVIS